MDNKIEMLSIASLTAYAKNSRTHSPAQIKQIEASIKEFGFTNPILIDAKGEIIAGHGRATAAAGMGIEVVPCLRMSHMTEAQKRAYVIADNKLAENAGWDEEILKLELEYLAKNEFDINLLGFGCDEIELLLKDINLTGGNTDENEVPTEPENPVTKPGDIWELGKHRIICGSSTDAETVTRLLDGKKPHLMVTDPPYGVEYDASWREEANISKPGGGQKGRS